MLRNLLFDFGQVLVRFDPLYMVRADIADEDDARRLANVLFDRLYWDPLDAGTIADEEVIRAAEERLPARLRPYVAPIYYAWVDRLPEIAGMREILKKWRARGYHIYVLSNISRYFSDHADRVPILSLTEGAIYSAVCGATKPSRAIFAAAEEKFGILPAETLFIDDSPKNIAGAAAAGFSTYLFDGDAGRLAAYLEKAAPPLI